MSKSASEKQPLLGGPGQNPRGDAFSPGYGQPGSSTGGQPPPPPASGYQGGPAPSMGVPTGGMPMPTSGEGGPSLDATASAPPLEEMDRVAGYDNIGFSEGSFIAPPSYDAATMPQPQSGVGTHQNVQQLSEEEVREALLDFVASNCCYGKKAAQEMVITQVIATNAFHYTLETFSEKRSTSWDHKPYKGQPIDGCMNGPAPLPWDIQVPIPKLFINKCIELEVPHTSSIKQCHRCCGRGYNRCHHCSGRGFDICHHCSGQGRKWTKHAGEADHGHWERCFICHGTGRRSCSSCSGHGQVMCPTCRTYGSLQWYIKLTVTWTNHLNDHVVEATELPAELVVSADGPVALEEDYPRLAPLTTFPDRNVNDASAMMLSKHETEFRTERIHRQRHRVRIVPISECQCSWSGKTTRFWVYGERRQVYAPDYPQQCCCGCTLL